MKYIIYLINICLLIMIPLSVIDANPNTVLASVNKEVKKLNSKYVMANRNVVVEEETTEDEEKEEEVEETTEDDNSSEKEIKKEETKIPVKTESSSKSSTKSSGSNNNTTSSSHSSSSSSSSSSSNSNPNSNSNSSTSSNTSSGSNNVYVGDLSGYKPDCKGCTGYLGCRLPNGTYMNVKELNTMYYNDSQYGNVRIVAGDTDFKCGTIVQISPSIFSSTTITAIVLDRGGDIGFDGRFLFDLLFTSDYSVSGYSKGVTFTVLRNGW